MVDGNGGGASVLPERLLLFAACCLFVYAAFLSTDSVGMGESGGGDGSSAASAATSSPSDKESLLGVGGMAGAANANNRLAHGEVGVGRCVDGSYDSDISTRQCETRAQQGHCSDGSSYRRFMARHCQTTCRICLVDGIATSNHKTLGRKGWLALASASSPSASAVASVASASLLASAVHGDGDGDSGGGGNAGGDASGGSVRGRALKPLPWLKYTGGSTEGTPPHNGGQCNRDNSYVFVKTHKTGGSTLANILHRRTWRLGLTPVFAKGFVNMGWPGPITPKSVLGNAKGNAQGAHSSTTSNSNSNNSGGRNTGSDAVSDGGGGGGRGGGGGGGRHVYNVTGDVLSAHMWFSEQSLAATQQLVPGTYK